MHRPPFARTKRRPRRSRRLRPGRALKNWLPRHRSSRHRTRSSTRRRRSRRGQRRLVYRARAGLRHDHSRWRSNRSPCLRGSVLHLRNDIGCRRLRRWTRSPWRSGDGWRCRNRTCSSRCDRGGRCDGNLGRNDDHRRRPISGSYRSRRHHSRRRRRRRVNHWLGWHCLWRPRLRFYRRLLNRRLDCRAGGGMLGDSLLLRDGAQHVSGPRNIRQVNLGLDAFVAVGGTRSLHRTRRPLGAAAEMLSHQFRFVILENWNAFSSP